MIKEKQNILIIGNLHHNPSTEAFLKKFLNILSPSINIVLLSGGIPPEFQNRVKWLNTNFKFNESSCLLISAFNYFLNQAKFVITLLNLFKEYKIEFIIFLAPSPILMLISKICRKKILKYEGGIYSKQSSLDNNTKSIKNYLLRLILEKFPRILSTIIIIESKSSLKFQNLENYRSKTVIAPLYVDNMLFICKKKIYKRESKIGFVGNLDHNKGFDNFLKSIILNKEYIKENRLKVVIIGEGDLYEQGIDLIKDNKLSNEVIFIGWIPHESLNDYLNEFKLLVLPSHSEGLPNIILESMACGTPVLATSVGGIPDIIKEGKTGFIIDNNSPECIAQNIKRVINHPNLDIIAENARKIIENKYNYKNVVDNYMNILVRLGGTFED